MNKYIKNCKKAAEDEHNNEIIRNTRAEPRNYAFKAIKSDRTPDVFYIHRSFLLLKIFEKIATREDAAITKSKASETL